MVTRAYEEGEEQLLEEDAECTSTFVSSNRSWVNMLIEELGWADEQADDERSFLIDEQLEFRFGSLDGDATCAWRDLSGDDDDLWEFVSSRVSCQQRCFVE